MGNRSEFIRKPMVTALFGILITFMGVAVASAGQEVVEGGVLHVRNGAEPSQGKETLNLEEMWRIGGDEDEGLLLGVVSEVAGDAAGNTYVMDAQLCEVHVIAPDGELLRTIFREGEGPGEVHRPRDMVITAEGVGLAQEFPAKIVMVDFAGLPLPNISPVTEGGLPGLVSVTRSGENLLVSGSLNLQGDTPGVQDRIYFLSSFSQEGKELVRYCATPGSYDFNNFVFAETVHTPSFWWGFTVGPDGRIYVTETREEYAITVYNADGSIDRIIEREYKSLKRSKDERQRIKAIYESATKGIPVPVTLVIDDYEPDIAFFHRGIRITDDGSMWVTTSQGITDQKPGILATYDVFDPRGHFVKQVAVACEGTGAADNLFFISDDRAVLVTDALAALGAQFGSGAAADSDADEATPQEIIGYRVP